MKQRWYSPRLCREVVSRLYHKARAEGIPMTTLVNRIVGQALDAENAVEMRTPEEGISTRDPN